MADSGDDALRRAEAQARRLAETLTRLHDSRERVARSLAATRNPDVARERRHIQAELDRLIAEVQELLVAAEELVARRQGA
jgi:hypothetical protein